MNPCTDYRESMIIPQSGLQTLPKADTTVATPRLETVLRRWFCWAVCLLFWQLLLAQAAFADWHRADAAIMGTAVSAEIWHDDPEQAKELLALVMDEMRRIDAAYSPYIADSELSVLNRTAAKRGVRVSDELWLLLQASEKISTLSNGAFDITYASAGRLYDYRKRERPVDADLAQAIEAINFRHVVLMRRQRVRYSHPGVYVDLGGIAKGYAVDRCVELLQERGVTQGMVAAGGDSRIIGDRKGRPWTVGVQDPRDAAAMIAVLPLVDTAVSTSGDYERFFEEEGIRYHHILNPGTGDSARDVRSVTILGPEGLLTDALSTTVFVLGLRDGLALIDTLPGIDAVVVDGAGNLRYSADIDPLR